MKNIDCAVFGITSAAIGIGLASNMAIVSTFCDESALSDFGRLFDSFNRFQNAHIKAIQQKNLKSSASIKAGKLFLNELKNFKKLPVAQNKKLWLGLDEMEQAMQGLLSAWK